MVLVGAGAGVEAGSATPVDAAGIGSALADAGGGLVVTEAVDAGKLERLSGTDAATEAVDVAATSTGIMLAAVGDGAMASGDDTGLLAERDGDCDTPQAACNPANTARNNGKVIAISLCCRRVSAQGCDAPTSVAANGSPWASYPAFHRVKPTPPSRKCRPSPRFGRRRNKYLLQLGTANGAGFALACLADDGVWRCCRSRRMSTLVSTVERRQETGVGGRDRATRVCRNDATVTSGCSRSRRVVCE